MKTITYFLTLVFFFLTTTFCYSADDPYTTLVETMEVAVTTYCEETKVCEGGDVTDIGDLAGTLQKFSFFENDRVRGMVYVDEFIIGNTQNTVGTFIFQIPKEGQVIPFPYPIVDLGNPGTTDNIKFFKITVAGRRTITSTMEQESIELWDGYTLCPYDPELGTWSCQ